MSRLHETAQAVEKFFLVFVNSEESEDAYVEAELEGLVEAADAQVVGSLRQRVGKPVGATYLGSGKVLEIKHAAEEAGADAIVVDTELSGVQLRNLEDKTEKRIIDRTQIILDIFAKRAHTREGRLQVELAQHAYRLPRLMSFYTEFERQRGGIRMRGPGETQLESDRRLVEGRITKLKQELEEVRQHRVQQREGRERHAYPVASIVGYTSAGKSTLMNQLTGSDLLADAMPFATLDPTTRRLNLPGGYSVYLTDTVGFIRNLPTQLVAAFRATLEEVNFADVLLHVIDVSLPEWEHQADSVAETIDSLGAGETRVLTVFNKIDALPDSTFVRKLVSEWPSSVAISAKTGEGIPDLVAALEQVAREFLGVIHAVIPYDQASLLESCYQNGRVLAKEYRPEGIYVEVEVVPEMRARLAPFEAP